MGRVRRALGMLGALALASAGFAAGCVDGVTPDCSDAATPCGPSLDGASGGAEAAIDAPADTSALDTFVPDAPPDVALDAGDEV